MAGAPRRRVLRGPWGAWGVAGVVLLAGTVWGLRYTETWRPRSELMAAVVRGAAEPPLWSGPVTDLDVAQLATKAHLDVDGRFEVEWTGLLVAEESGLHRFRLRVDDGVALWVDDREVIDRLVATGEHQHMGAVWLARGLHSLRLRYVQAGGNSVLRLAWHQPSSREQYATVPTLLATDPPPVYRRIDKAMRLPRQLAIGWAMWLLVGLTLVGGWVLEKAAGTRLATVLGRRERLALLAVSTLLLGIDVDIGLHPWRGWAPDEVGPQHVLWATDAGFAGGWHHLYPPFMFYVFAVLHGPFELLAARGWLELDSARALEALHLVDRLASVALGVLTCAATALLASIAVGRNGARWAVLSLLGIPVFAFYAKTTNVDMAYTFWIMVVALACARVPRHAGARTYVLIGAAAAAAVAAKDQAYGFLPGAALLLGAATWRQSGGVPFPDRLMRAATDRRLWTGLVTFGFVWSLLAGLWWNPDGVRAHVALITGQGSAPFRLYPPTPGGLLQLGAMTLLLVCHVLGPATSLAVLVGVGLAVGQRGALDVRLLAMPATYLFTFIAVIGYVYDRFFLGVLPFLAVFSARGVLWLETLTPPDWRRVTARACLIALLLYPTLLLDVRLRRDSRFAAEAWMAEHLQDDPLVLGVGSALYLPNLHPYQHRVVASGAAEDILEWRPDVVVLNEDWFERPGQPAYAGLEQSLLAQGFARAYRSAPGRPGLWQSIQASSLFVNPLFSNISKISPPIAIWRKGGPQTGAGR